MLGNHPAAFPVLQPLGGGGSKVRPSPITDVWTKANAPALCERACALVASVSEGKDVYFECAQGQVWSDAGLQYCLAREP